MSLVLVYGPNTYSTNEAVAHVVGTRFQPWSYMFQNGHLMHLHSDLNDYRQVFIFISDDPEYVECANLALINLGASLRANGLQMPRVYAYKVYEPKDWFWEGVRMIFGREPIIIDIADNQDVCNYILPTKLPVNVYYSGSMKHYWQIDQLQASNISSQHGTIVKMDTTRVDWNSEMANCSIAIICVYKFTAQITDMITHMSVAIKKYPVKFILIRSPYVKVSGGYYGLALRLLNNPIVLESRGSYGLLTSAIRRLEAQISDPKQFEYSHAQAARSLL